jgi:hypothetical protein
MNRQSKRFSASKWSQRLVPLLLLFLLLGLVVTLLIVFLSVLGLTPSF